ncbi:protein-tyrosine phosphatase [Cladochytrium replicatum]|nr:protein-tyrosine phosphatase [Cladochytrium replicatum]
MPKAPKVVVPPLNFAMVAPGVYRSGHPNRKNFPFLKKLGLKSVMYLCTDDYSEDNLKFFAENNITIFHVKIESNKEPFEEIDHGLMEDALLKMLDIRNHPILIHCNKGKHRVGCLVGCLRKLQNWGMTSIFDEYRRFTGVKYRIVDQEYIEVFKVPTGYDKEHAPSWL